RGLRSRCVCTVTTVRLRTGPPASPTSADRRGRGDPVAQPACPGRLGRTRRPWGAGGCRLTRRPHAIDRSGVRPRPTGAAGAGRGRGGRGGAGRWPRVVVPSPAGAGGAAPSGATGLGQPDHARHGGGGGDRAGAFPRPGGGAGR